CLARIGFNFSGGDERRVAGAERFGHRREWDGTCVCAATPRVNSAVCKIGRGPWTLLLRTKTAPLPCLLCIYRGLRFPIAASLSNFCCIAPYSFASAIRGDLPYAMRQETQPGRATANGDPICTSLCQTAD